MTKRSKQLGLVIPTPEEDAAINAGIKADADTRELSPKDVAFMTRSNRRGRPAVSNPKVSVTIRFDSHIVQAFKAKGDGWQTRMNDVLGDAVKRGKLSV